MAVDGPAQGTNMGSMQALNTSSSVSGATTWFLNQRTSLKHSDQNHGSVGGGGVESPLLFIVSCTFCTFHALSLYCLTQEHPDTIH